MRQHHFIAGLPRSGSTLLASILNQNPMMSAGITWPTYEVFNAVQISMGNRTESSGFLTHEHRRALLRHVVEDCHDDHEIIFDTNRLWPAKLDVLADLFPECCLICCVRSIPWIVDSIERLVRRNVHDLSGIFNFEAGHTVFDRAKILTEGGLIGSANMAMMSAFYGDQAHRMMLIEFDALTKYPADVMREVYNFLDLPMYEWHDYEKIEPIPGAADFDKRMGTPGLHDLARRVEHKERQTILPPELFNSFGQPFWRRGASSKARVLQCHS